MYISVCDMCRVCVCMGICIYIPKNRDGFVYQLMLIALLEWSLWVFGPGITPVSRNQHQKVIAMSVVCPAVVLLTTLCHDTGSFSVGTLWIFWAGQFFVVQDARAHGRTFVYPGLQTRETSSTVHYLEQETRSHTFRSENSLTPFSQQQKHYIALTCFLMYVLPWNREPRESVGLFLNTCIGVSWPLTVCDPQAFMHIYSSAEM